MGSKTDIFLGLFLATVLLTTSVVTAAGDLAEASTSRPPPFVPTPQDVNNLEALEKQVDELRKYIQARFDEVLNSLSTSVPLLIGFAMVVPHDNKFLTTTDPTKAMKLALIPISSFLVGFAVILHVTKVKFRCLSASLTTGRCEQVHNILSAVKLDFHERGIIMPVVPRPHQVGITMAPDPAPVRVANGLMNSVYHQRLLGVEDSFQEISEGRTFSVSFYTILFHLVVAVVIIIAVKVLGAFLLFHLSS